MIGLRTTTPTATTTTRPANRRTIVPCAQRAAAVVTPRASLSDGAAPTAPHVDRRAAMAALAAAVAATVAAGAAPAALAEDADTCTYNKLENGLEWCDLRVGDGPSPVPGAMVRAHYRGVLASNGREFDSSYSRGRPLSFAVGKGQVIRGWDAAILGNDADLPAMKEGGKRRVVIPSALAYGDRGAGGVIPPGATLDFIIELLPKRRK
jgi:peptidylprolyl isomerase